MEINEAVVLQKLGNNLRRLREKKGWSLRDLSDRCGIDNSKISKIEKGTQYHHINPDAIVYCTGYDRHRITW